MVFNILAFVFGYGFTSAAYMYFYLRVPMILKRRYSSIKTTSSEFFFCFFRIEIWVKFLLFMLKKNFEKKFQKN